MRTLVVLFVILESFLYVSFLWIDLFIQSQFQIGNQLKFFGIVLCLIFTVIETIKRKFKGSILMLALIFVTISDYFLLLENNDVMGMLTFCVAQICFLVYIQNKKACVSCLIRNLLVTVAFVGIFLAFNIRIDTLFVLVLFYFVTFLFNLLASITMLKKKPTLQMKYFVIGFVLYMLCDLNVAIFNLQSYLTIQGEMFSYLYEFATIAMWAFYLPGIAIISFSSSKVLEQ